MASNGDTILSMTSNSSTTAQPSFSEIPWCAALLADPSFSLYTTQLPTTRSNTGDTFFGSTLATRSTVSACVSQQRNPIHNADTGSPEPEFPAITEVRTFFMLGDGVNGHPHIAHGGFIAAILDESMGNLLAANKDFEERGAQRTGRPYKRVSTMTGSLSLRFRRPLPTPSAVMVRTWVDRVEGRKFFLLGSVENGDGEVYTEGSAVFIGARDVM